MNKCYCPVCKKEVFYNITEKTSTATNYDVPFEYNEKTPVCENCGEELYVDEIEKENQNTIKEIYKVSNGIISNAEINEILDKYNVSKRVLPYVLGIGELTITRYLDGYMPTKKISTLLKDILNDPSLYKEYLEKNKSLLTSNTYAKTSNKVNKLLGISTYDEKLEKYADYIISKNVEITNLELNRELYFSEVFYHLFTSKKMFNSLCGAWEHGPVYGQIYFENKYYGNNPIEKPESKLSIDEDERLIIDKVIDCFGIYSGKVLTFFTHEDGPWKKAYENNEQFISEKDIKEFALRIKNEYNINDIKDIEKYSDAMFKKYKMKYC